MKKGRVKSYTIDYDSHPARARDRSRPAHHRVDARAHLLRRNPAARTSSSSAGACARAPSSPRARSSRPTLRRRATLVAEGHGRSPTTSTAVLKNLERWTGAENEAKLVQAARRGRPSAITTANQTMTHARARGRAPREELRGRRRGAREGDRREPRGAPRVHRREPQGRRARSTASSSPAGSTRSSNEASQDPREHARRLQPSRDLVLQRSSTTRRSASASSRSSPALERAEQNLSKLTGVVQTEVVT